jgi:acetoacetyl-CoA synthetase
MERKESLVVKKPFPSMPVKFWGDDDGQKYHKAYFKDLKIFGIMVILLNEL